jgi:hypothetical protein
MSTNCGSLDISPSCGPPCPATGIALPFYLLLSEISLELEFLIIIFFMFILRQPLFRMKEYF